MENIIKVSTIENPVKISTSEEVVKISTSETLCNISIIEQKNVIEPQEEIIEIVTEETPVVVETFDNITINNITALGDYILTKKAGEAIGGHRVVKIENNKSYYADNSIILDAFKIIGITKGASSIDADCIITTYGEVEEPSWSWEEGKPLFLGTNGALTQTCPETGFILQIATVLNSKKIFIDIKIPLF